MVDNIVFVLLVFLDSIVKTVKKIPIFLYIITINLFLVKVIGGCGSNPCLNNGLCIAQIAAKTPGFYCTCLGKYINDQK